jgi:hypothetical protein
MTFPKVRKASPVTSFLVIVGSTIVLWTGFFQVYYSVTH